VLQVLRQQPGRRCVPGVCFAEIYKGLPRLGSMTQEIRASAFIQVRLLSPATAEVPAGIVKQICPDIWIGISAHNDSAGLAAGGPTDNISFRRIARHDCYARCRVRVSLLDIRALPRRARVCAGIRRSRAARDRHQDRAEFGHGRPVWRDPPLWCHCGAYFADAGNAGNLSTSRASC